MTTFTTLQASTPPGPLTLEDAREYVRESALISTASTYGNTRVDRAIRMALEKALRVTKADWTLTDITIPTDSRTIDLTASEPNLKPERYISGWIDDHQVQPISYHKLARMHKHSTNTGRPEWIAWASENETHLYPKTDKEYIMKTQWWKPLVDFTPGTSNAANINLNVPISWVYDALWWGASSALVHSDPDEVMQSVAWQRFERLLNEVAGDQIADWGPLDTNLEEAI